MRQLDVKNVFLHSNPKETVYCEQSKGFVDPAAPNSIYLLQKSLYGLKQAPRAWNQRFSNFICSIDFTTSKSDASLFVYKAGDAMAYLLLYVDDIIITVSSSTLLQHVTSHLSSEFAMTDLGDLHHFLGISVTWDSSGLFLSQRQYTVDLLQRAGMSECHVTATPVDARTKLSASEGAPVANPSEYKSLAGALQYLTLTRPDLAYAVQQVCLFMHDPHGPHLALIKCILRYVKGSLSAGLQLGLGAIDQLTAYSDANWVAAPTHAAPPPASASISATTWCLGLPSVRRLYLAPVPKRSTVQWSMLLLSVAGCVSYYMSSTSPSRVRRLSIVTM
jgi:hypothetical protein